MNRPKSATIARNKTDRSATASKIQLNKQTSPVKQPLRKKSEQRSSSKTRPESNSRSTGTIVVCDRGTQCNRYTEGVNKLDPIESAQLLGVMKDLRGLKKDDTSSKVINHVEQLLYEAFSIDVGKSMSRSKQNTEAILLQAKLQKLTTQLEATSRKQIETNALFQREKEILNAKLQEQKALLQETQNRGEEFRRSIQKFQDEKKEADKLIKNQDKLICQLKKQLNEETQNKLIAEQYVKFEKEKNQILSEYKDKLLQDLRFTLKDLQNSAAEQFANLREAYVSDEDHQHIMMVNKEFTCLSTSRSSSAESSPYDTHPWKDESETNVSEISQNRAGVQFNEHGLDKKRHANYDKKVNRVHNIEDDLISLPNEDHPMSEMSYFARSNKPTNE